MILLSTRARFLRFLGTGVVNTAFGYGVFLAGLLAGLPPTHALALQFTLGIPFNFFLHRRLVFAVGGVGRLPLYAAAYLTLYGLNLVLLQGLAAALPPAMAQGLLMLPMACLSFLVLSRIMR